MRQDLNNGRAPAEPVPASVQRMAGYMAAVVTKQRTKGVTPEPARRVVAALLLALVALLCRPEPGWTEPIAGELSRSHAAFLLSAARFTTWPAEAFQEDASPLVFCIYKDRETGMALRERLQGETIRGRAMQKVDIDNFMQLSQCHVVYLPASRLGDYPAAANSSYGILTISDCREFAEAGGMLGFVLGDQGVEVIVNPEAISHSGLSISPSLLQMAELVKTKQSGTGIRCRAR